MTDPLDTEAREQHEAAERKRAKRLYQRERADVQQLLSTDAGRRLVHAFLTDAGEGATAYRNNPQAMAHAVGWQDAASWWLNKIRQHCPEREGQMRNEARLDSQEQDEASNDD